MTTHRVLPGILSVCLIVSIAARPALALVKMDNAVSKRFKAASTVFVGTVTAVDLDRHVVEATATDTLKGPPAPQKFQIQTTLPDLLKSIAVGQPVVVIAKIGVVVHIAEGWYGAKRNPGPQIPTWIVNQVDNTGHRDFPGTTADLVRVMTELKEGKYSLLDKVETNPFQGGAKQIARLNIAKPTFLYAADVNGDGKPDLLVGTEKGIKLFLAAGDTFSDATEQWGLGGVAASAIAGADLTGTGRIDLLIDKTLYVNDGGKFTAAPSILPIDGDARAVAVSLKPFTGGSLADAALLLDDGRLLLFKNPGKAGIPWAKASDRKLPLAAGPPLAASFGDFAADGAPCVILFQSTAVTRYSLTGDAPSADFQRLTGDPLSQIKGLFLPLKNVSVTTIDLNGDGRDDLFVTADGASMAMVYRGFGAFIADADMGAEVKGLPFPMHATHSRAALHGDGKVPQDLYITGDDGSLFLVKNAAQ